ncbi:unnamed protein product [Absidia cylindrospora]
MTAISQQTSTTTEITKLLTSIAQTYGGLDDDDMNEDFMNDRNISLAGAQKRYEDHITRCIFYAVDSILFLFESNPNPLMSSQLEQWYQANVWTPVTDKLLSDLPGVVCVLGESTSISSRERKRRQGKQHGVKWDHEPI